LVKRKIHDRYNEIKAIKRDFLLLENIVNLFIENKLFNSLKAIIEVINLTP
jgi:hypothetical protein